MVTSHVRTTISFTVSVLLLGMLSACGKDGSSPTSPSRAQGLEGTWRATRAEYVGASNPGLRAEVVSQGRVVTLVLTGSAYTLTVPDPRVPDQVVSGTFTTTRDTMTLSRPGVSFTWVFDMNQSDDNLTLDGGHVLFDFDANGSFEEAVLDLALVRQ